MKENDTNVQLLSRAGSQSPATGWYMKCGLIELVNGWPCLMPVQATAAETDHAVGPQAAGARGIAAQHLAAPWVGGTA